MWQRCEMRPPKERGSWREPQVIHLPSLMTYVRVSTNTGPQRSLRCSWPPQRYSPIRGAPLSWPSGTVPLVSSAECTQSAPTSTLYLHTGQDGKGGVKACKYESVVQSSI